MTTIADVFIIESLSKDDEEKNRYEGQRLADLLKLSGKEPKYFYFQSKEEIPLLLQLFKISKYRYLHISCHASNDSICTTKDVISYLDFSTMCKNYLKLRRVFFSACELGNELFTECLAGKNKGMHSVVAPAEEIYFDHAAAIWAAFYVSIFSRNTNGMNGADIKKRIEILCTLFPVDFHVSTYQPAADSWNHKKIIKSNLHSRPSDTKGLIDPVDI